MEGGASHPHSSSCSPGFGTPFLSPLIGVGTSQVQALCARHRRAVVFGLQLFKGRLVHGARFQPALGTSASRLST